MARSWALAVLATLGGCAAQSRPVTVAAALHELQAQLQAAGAVSATGAGPARFADAARAAQCEAGEADPVVPVLLREVTVDLSGSFTATGGFAVGPSVAGGAPFGLTGGVSRGQTQGLTLPLAFAALSELPDVIAAQRAALFAGLPEAARRAGLRRVLAGRDALRARIARAIAGFDPAACAGKAAEAGRR
ncbi:MAG: hypothetical protein ACRYGC_13680 [Janthinobacterium lividum]